jgi:uncharacterized protein (TIGR04141 family)
VAPDRTREGTLYRLTGITPTADGMFDALTESTRTKQLYMPAVDIDQTTIAGAPALVVTAQISHAEAEWCRDMSVTTGLDISYDARRPSGLVLMAVDGIVYALGYGGGHRLVPDELKDRRFGIRYAIRAVDPREIHDLARIRPGAGGRQDSTLVPGGSPIQMIAMAEHAEMVRQIGGKVISEGLALSTRNGRKIMVKGGAGVRTRFPVDPGRFVAAIREIANVCASVDPPPELAFVEYILPVADEDTKWLLEDQLDDLLGPGGAADRVSMVAPGSALDDFAAARAFEVRIGSVASSSVPYLQVEDILQRARVQPAGHRSHALRSGRISMFEDERRMQLLDRCSAANWLEVTAWLGTQRFFLLDGTWYEIDAAYAQSARDEIADLFGGTPSLDLPPWDLSVHPREENYNLSVPILRDGYVCLDQKFAANPLGKSRLEVCDLLGPDNELIHVKRASGSQPLSHVCSQVLVGTQSLLRSPDVRRDFVALVKQHGRGRTVPENFRPSKVVLAILLRKGEKLTADTLFPFSQVSFAHTARALRSDLIDVEVIGINGDHPAVGRAPVPGRSFVASACSPSAA